MKKDIVHRFDTKIRYNDLDMFTVTYHPNYLVLCDKARNQAFEDFGYPIQDQLKDKVGFTVGSIDKCRFNRPLFMGEEVSVFTKLLEHTSKTLKVRQLICPKGVNDNESNTDVDIYEHIAFSLDITLVFVTIESIKSMPLSLNNASGIRAVDFSAKALETLNL